jgi:hypothetical protein
LGWKAAWASYGTPRSTQIVSVGTGNAAKAGTKSTGAGLKSIASMQSSVCC